MRLAGQAGSNRPSTIANVSPTEAAVSMAGYSFSCLFVCLLGFY